MTSSNAPPYIPLSGEHSPLHSKPVLMFYCQHSLGMGHLVRSFCLADALASHFQVLFLNGGPVPDSLPVPDSIELVNLPALGMGSDNQLISRDSRYSVEEACSIRQQKIRQLYEQYKPAALLIELFPFGRKKFAFELLPLLERAHAAGTKRPAIFCSLRDILVGSRRDQQRHDDRAAKCINRYFDAVLVHSDARFARLQETFRPTVRLAVDLIHTGFVSPDKPAGLVSGKQREGVLVSAGGGIVGMPLYSIALEAQAVLWQEDKLPMTLVAGPFLPETDWKQLQNRACGRAGLRLLRAVPNLRKLMADHRLSVSQCGYNTMMDLLATQPAALVVPFSRGQEDEQMNRAQRLQRLGLVKCLPLTELSTTTFLASLRSLSGFQPVRSTLNTRGAEHTEMLISQWQKPASYPAHAAAPELKENAV